MRAGRGKEEGEEVISTSVPTTAAEWVTAIDEAIYAVLRSHSYTLPDGRSVMREDLVELRKLRQEWAVKAGGSGIPVNLIEWDN